MTQERMTDADMENVDANAKVDAPDALNASKINTLNIYVNIGIERPCVVAISLS